MSRARVPGLLRVSATATATAFATQWLHRDEMGAFSEPSSSKPSKPTPDVLDAPIASNYPKTSSNKSTAQWRVYTDVARDLSARGDLEQAGTYLRRALHEATIGFGESDPHVAAARNNLAELYRLQKRFDEAEKLFAVAAAQLEKHYGTAHPAAGAAVHNLAGCKLAKGDYNGAYKTYASAAQKKAKALGTNHPDYAATLFHMAEAKRAGGAYVESATLLEESVRVLDASGQGESKDALRRLERLAQTQGDLMGDHVKAEGTRRRVLDAREHAAVVAEAWEGGMGGDEKESDTNNSVKKRGFVGATLAAAHGGAVAAAAEAHALSLAELKRWDDAIAALRRAVEVQEARVYAVTGGSGFSGRGARSGGDYGPRTMVDFFASGVQWVYESVNSVVGSDTDSDATRKKKEAAAAGVTNLKMQLASSRVKLADVMKRATDAGERNDSALHKRFALLSDAINALQPMAETAARYMGDSSMDSKSKVSGGTASATTTPTDSDSRTVSAFLKRKEETVFLEKHAAALVLFSRAARGMLTVARESEVLGKEDDNAVNLNDASCHVGDAIEWLSAAHFGTSSFISPDAPTTNRLRSALSSELRECRAILSPVLSN